MLDRLAVHNGRFENFRNTSVDGVTLSTAFGQQSHIGQITRLRSRNQVGWALSLSTYKVLNRAARGSENNGRRVIGLLALGLRVHPNKVEFVPHCLHQLVNVPPVLGADGHGVGDSIQQIKLLDADRVDLVEAVDHGNVTGGLPMSARRVHLYSRCPRYESSPTFDSWPLECRSGHRQWRHIG